MPPRNRRRPIQRALRVRRHLKLYQPWARVVSEGAIPVLLRTYSTHIRGWVGVISAARFDRRTIVNPFGDAVGFPMRSVIGAVRIDRVVPVPQGLSVRRVLAERFGRTLASFYPDHYIPSRGRPVYMWMLGAAALSPNPERATVKTGREWSRFPYTIRDPVVVYSEISGNGPPKR